MLHLKKVLSKVSSFSCKVPPTSEIRQWRKFWVSGKPVKEPSSSSIRFVRYLAVILAAAVLQSCTTPSGVATFADDSAKALDAGPPIFHDIYDSCVRRHTDAAPIAAVFLPAQAGGGTPAPAAACDVFAKQGDALSKAS